MAIGPIEGAALPLAQPNRPVANEAPVLDRIKEHESIPFSSIFLEAVASANAQGHEAHRAALALSEGRSDDIHGTMIEMSKAGIEMRLVTNVRNKVLDAFYEIWRMSI